MAAKRGFGSGGGGEGKRGFGSGGGGEGKRARLGEDDGDFARRLRHVDKQISDVTLECEALKGEISDAQSKIKALGVASSAGDARQRVVGQEDRSGASSVVANAGGKKAEVGEVVVEGGEELEEGEVVEKAVEESAKSGLAQSQPEVERLNSDASLVRSAGEGEEEEKKKVAPASQLSGSAPAFRAGQKLHINTPAQLGQREEKAVLKDAPPPATSAWPTAGLTAGPQRPQQSSAQRAQQALGKGASQSCKPFWTMGWEACDGTCGHNHEHLLDQLRRTPDFIDQLYRGTLPIWTTVVLCSFGLQTSRRGLEPILYHAVYPQHEAEKEAKAKLRRDATSAPSKTLTIGSATGSGSRSAASLPAFTEDIDLPRKLCKDFRQLWENLMVTCPEGEQKEAALAKMSQHHGPEKAQLDMMVEFLKEQQQASARKSGGGPTPAR